MENILNILKRDTERLKEYTLRKRIIDYYNTENQGKVSIPSFMLADEQMNRLRVEGRIDELYRKHELCIEV